MRNSLKKSHRWKEIKNFYSFCFNSKHWPVLRKDFARERRYQNWQRHVINDNKPDLFINDKRDYYRREYLRSDHWKNLKREKFKTQKECEICKFKRHLDVHHKVYKNLYDVELSDLQVLCRRCHYKLHQK